MNNCKVTVLEEKNLKTGNPDQDKSEKDNLEKESLKKDSSGK